MSFWTITTRLHKYYVIAVLMSFWTITTRL